MELSDISGLLDEKLNPIIKKLEKIDNIENRLTIVEEKLDKILSFVAIGNEDVTKKLKKLVS